MSRRLLLTAAEPVFCACAVERERHPAGRAADHSAAAPVSSFDLSVAFACCCCALRLRPFLTRALTCAGSAGLRSCPVSLHRAPVLSLDAVRLPLRWILLECNQARFSALQARRAVVLGLRERRALRQVRCPPFV